MLDGSTAVPVELGAPLGVAWALGVGWLLLFTSRRAEWGALMALLTTMHALPVLWLAQVAPGRGLSVDAGWIALTAWPLLALVVHIREGAHRTRQLALAVLGGILALTSAAAVLSPDPLAVLIRGLCRGILTFIDAIAVLAVWEILGHRRVAMPLRLGGAVLLALAFDATAQGCFEAVVRGEPFDGYVLGALSVAVVAASMHSAVGILWVLVHPADHTVESRDRALLDVLSVMLGTRRYIPMRPDRVRDPASGLYRRTFLDDRVPVELERAEHMAATIAVIVLDARDDPARVGRALLSSVRLTDLPCRWAPDRYVAVLPGADRAAARTSARRTVDRFRGEATVGVAVYPDDGETLQELVDAGRRRAKAVPRL